MTTDPSNDPHIAVLQALLVADREALIARYQQWAESDAATGHMAGQRHWQERADELRATPFSWEKGKQAGERSSAA